MAKKTESNQNHPGLTTDVKIFMASAHVNVPLNKVQKKRKFRIDLLEIFLLCFLATVMIRTNCFF